MLGEATSCQYRPGNKRYNGILRVHHRRVLHFNPMLTRAAPLKSHKNDRIAEDIFLLSLQENLYIGFEELPIFHDDLR